MKREGREFQTLNLQDTLPQFLPVQVVPYAHFPFLGRNLGWVGEPACFCLLMGA